MTVGGVPPIVKETNDIVFESLPNEWGFSSYTLGGHELTRRMPLLIARQPQAVVRIIFVP